MLNVITDRVRAPMLLLLSLAIYGCSRNAPANIQTVNSQSAEQVAPDVAQQSPPAAAEVNEAVTRIFRQAARADSASSPNFLAGDFNGDKSVDIAVILKPVAGKLDEMNQQFPPWILRDPFVTPKPGAAPMRIADDELLLAVIHGYGPKGWRDPQATQTYLLKNSVGQDVKAQSKTEVANANKGNSSPRLAGDLIGETLRGKSGYIYFDGAQYSWYDPKTFKGGVDARLIHPGVKSNPNKFDLLHPKFVPAEK
ncbi:MAG TPA: hypothetical protein VN696_03170 [Pyrinomonadaceae bacterium]|nr:hypothetical protein [Pyrinomonadaceae bacterium]